jgi:hypothetical protein
MKTDTFILGISILISLNSCGFYQVQMVDIPLISHKKDLRLDIGASIIPSAYATVSYGLTNELSIQSYIRISDKNKYYIQEALGFYKKLTDNKVLEWYNGVGYGYGNAYNDANPGNLTGNYHQIFTQLNYGKTNCQFANMDIGIGFKAGYIGATLLNDNNYYEPFQISNVESHSLLFEPQAFVRLGGKRLKFSTKLGYGVLFKLFKTNKELPYEPLNIGIGLNYHF